MPAEAFELFKDALNKHQILTTNDFSECLGYCLLTQEETGFASYADCNQDFSNKIKNNLKDYASFEDFIDILKSKDMTYTRINRCLLHILLCIRQCDYTIGRAIGYAPYLRILGFKNDASKILSKIKRSTEVPIITKATEGEILLDYATNKFFDKDIFASNLYYQHVARKSGTKPKNEFTNQIIIL